MQWVKRIALTRVAIVVLLLAIGLILPSTFDDRVKSARRLLAAFSRIWYAFAGEMDRLVGPGFEAGLKNLKATVDAPSAMAAHGRPLRRCYCVEASRFCGMFIQTTYVPNCLAPFSTMVT